MPHVLFSCCPGWTLPRFRIPLRGGRGTFEAEQVEQVGAQRQLCALGQVFLVNVGDVLAAADDEVCVRGCYL